MPVLATRIIGSVSQDEHWIEASNLSKLLRCFSFGEKVMSNRVTNTWDVHQVKGLSMQLRRPAGSQIPNVILEGVRRDLSSRMCHFIRAFMPVISSTPSILVWISCVCSGSAARLTYVDQQIRIEFENLVDKLHRAALPDLD